MNASPNRRRAVSPTEVPPLRLLVVDDEPDYSAWIVVLARRVGFEVDTAGNADAALEAISSGAYDAAIIDQEMPRMTGVGLIARLRADEATKSLYAVMLSGHEDMSTKLAALDAGFDDFMTKSSADVEIVAKLAAARRIAARQRTMNVAIRELYGLATRDELTGLFNRRFFMAEVERLLSQGTAVSVILFDLDGFKMVNDTHGHLAGDRVLRDVGALFHRSTRPADIVARFGGDEFVMAIPERELSGIRRIARRLSRDVHSLQWTIDGASFRVGVSTGMASSHMETSASLAQLLDAADRDMYRNKWLRKHPQRDAPEARPRAL